MELADAFAAGIGPEDVPQPHYIDAYLHLQRGDLPAARAAINRALALDPRHLLAVRLQQQIEAANGDD